MTSSLLRLSPSQLSRPSKVSWKEAVSPVTISSWSLLFARRLWTWFHFSLTKVTLLSTVGALEPGWMDGWMDGPTPSPLHPHHHLHTHIITCKATLLDSSSWLLPKHWAASFTIAEASWILRAKSRYTWKVLTTPPEGVGVRPHT